MPMVSDSPFAERYEQEKSRLFSAAREPGLDGGPAGRAAEIAAVRDFLTATAGTPSAVVITGDAGIGKTVVWKHVLRTACRDYRVLSCRPAPAEAPLAFSALGDLFGGVIDEVLPVLARERRRAVDAALLRGSHPASPGHDPVRAGRTVPEWHVLARGILDALRFLSAGTPLLLAVDNVHWLDRPSADVLEFCIRRLAREAVSILLTLRGNALAFPLGLEQALPPAGLAHVPLGSLSPDAVSEILQSRFGVTFPGYTLTRLHQACGGNPFYALQSARALLKRGGTYPADEPIPVPAEVSESVRSRLCGLTGDALRVGRLLAASRDPREQLIRAAGGDHDSWVAVDQAIDEGLVERDGDALRFTHPLLGAVLYAEMTRGERRDVHRRLASSAAGTEDRAWHRALSAEGPSDQVAAMLDGAARQAASRGALAAAAVFEEQAVRLTPARDLRQSRERTMRAADYHFRAGDFARSRELIESLLAGCCAGSDRASLLIRVGAIHYHQSGWMLAEQMLSRAAREAREAPARRAHAEQELAFIRLMAGDLPAAAGWARASLRSAERAARPSLVAHSLACTAVCEFLQGNRGWPDLLDRAEAVGTRAEDEPFPRLMPFDPALVRGAVLTWCDRLDEARVRFDRCYRHAVERGDDASLPFLLCHFSELECWAGNWDAAEEHALEGCRVTGHGHRRTLRPAALYSLALVRAHRGQVDEAREFAAEAIALCERSGNVLLMSSVLSVLGFAALSAGDHQAAHSHLAAMAVSLKSGEPGVVKFLPDEIESLTALGDISLARSYTLRLEQQGNALGRTWALATAARCRAQVAGATGDHEGARVACADALARHERLAMPFELGRTLLAKGLTERQARQKTAARDSIGQALGIFERLGAPLWAAKARRELSEIVPVTLAGGLTETQHRVAALIAEGRTNREIASALFVTQNTVQTHIRHIFQKLGVRSRTELAVRLLAGPLPAGLAPRTLTRPETG